MSVYLPGRPGIARLCVLFFFPFFFGNRRTRYCTICPIPVCVGVVWVWEDLYVCVCVCVCVCISHMFHIQTSECATQGGHQRRTSFSAPYHRSKVGIFCPLVGLFFPLVGLFYILGISTRPASARPITGFKRDLFTKETYVDAKEPQVSFILFCFFYKRDLRRRKRATASDRAGWLVTALFC